KNPERFNRSSVSPKDATGNVKPLHQWTLAQLIDTACDIQLLHLDVKKFSHGLRDFRNYIHPYEQMISGFTPDEHTAKVCFQVLKAALASVAGERRCPTNRSPCPPSLSATRRRARQRRPTLWGCGRCRSART